MRVLALVPLLALGAACAPVAPMTGRSDRGRPPSIAPAPRPAEASPLDLEPLTLERAQALVLAHNPGLAAARGALGAAEGQTLQAGTLPNPELEVEVENVGGSRAFGGVGASETTFVMRQPIPLGGKLGLRETAARKAEEAAAWRVRAEARRLRSETAAAFVEVLVAQAEIRLADERESLARELERVVAARVEAGKVSPVEGSHAAVVVADARVASAAARWALRRARRRLSVLWGDEKPRFNEAVGDLGHLGEIPDTDALAAATTLDPEVRASEADTAARAADARAEARAWWPDLSVGAGARYFAESGEYAFVGLLSVPLPLFDRGQGTRLAADASRAMAAADARAAAVRARAAALDALEGLRAARERVRALEDEIVPAAARTLAASREGYRAGKFGYLDVLTAQQTLVGARARRLEALRDYHLHRAALARWTDPAPEAPDREGDPR